MAQELDDGEFWLPSEFLTDDDLLMDFKNDNTETKRDDFPHVYGASFGFNSDLSSPVESVMGSTETESDEDELISGLTRKMANSNLQDATFSTEYTAKGLKLSGSPQSTLCGFKPGSSQSSPNSVSRVSSPPPVSKDAVGWDLLYAAAGEVARMWGTEEGMPFRSTKLFAPPPKPVSATLPIKKTNPVTGYYPNHSQTEAHLAYLQLQATHFQRMKQQQQQQMMKNGVWSQEKIDYPFQNGKLNGEIGRPQGLSTAAWPTLQQSQQQQQPQAGSGMRAVFLGEPAAKKERTGTGVFLPRRFGANSTETRKKPGLSTTVLLPEKVVHALNLNLESIDVQPPLRCNRNFTPELDAALKQRNNILMAQQRRTNIPQPVMNQELRLPQEWTY